MLRKARSWRACLPIQLLASQDIAPVPVPSLWNRWLSSGGSGGGGSGDAASRAEARLSKAKKYKEQQERQAVQDQGGGAPAPDVPPPSRLAAEYDEALQAYFMSAPSGLGALAENQIRAGIKAGALDNLQGKGKPLSQEDQGAQFFRVDPLMQAMTRTMGAQNMRPESLDRRDALQRQLAALRRQVAEEVRRALAPGREQRGRGQQQTPAEGGGRGGGQGSMGSRGSGSGGGGGGLLGRLWGQLSGFSGPGGSGTAGTAGRAGEAAEGVGAGVGPGAGGYMEMLRAGQHPGLLAALEEADALVRQYNSAVLQDKETYGSHWPLNQHPRLSLAAEVDRALAEVGGQREGQGPGQLGGQKGGQGGG